MAAQCSANRLILSNMPILKSQKGNVLTKEQLAYLNKQGLTGERPSDKMAQSNIHNKPLTRGDYIGKNIADFATGVAVGGTQLRRPTQEEIRMGRAGGMERAKLLANAATIGLTGEMVGAAMPVVARAVSKIPQAIKNIPGRCP
jgi:hypothetical protein